MLNGALLAVHYSQKAGGGTQHDALVHDAILYSQIFVLNQPAAVLKSIMTPTSIVLQYVQLQWV
jgi:hypothetical protein